MKKIFFVLIFLISGFTFAITTITLEDQCNCAVLHVVDDYSLTKISLCTLDTLQIDAVNSRPIYLSALKNSETYFYKFDYENENGITKSLSECFYLNR